MRTAGEALKRQVSLLKEAAALECSEAALSTNKAWVSAQAHKAGKRGPSSHIPIEGRHPETVKTRMVKMLDATTTVMEQMIAVAREEHEYGSLPPRRSNPAWEARRQAVLNERDVSAVQLAFVYGYSDSKSVRELRIRNGLDENTGRPLADNQRPIISTSRRVRK